ncbi:MAG: PLP-dependent aminotransferase family protein, partial [Lachnospiraceae bacterium]|nr:PLP-dependent aminotransferase family protein [Lachnospiraceae bacterium]
DALAAATASVLHITPYRSFPSGVTADVSKRREYLRWGEEPGRFIVEDDFESEFSLLRKHEETVFSNARSHNVIYLNTFSRTVSPALRAGYMVLPEQLVPVFAEKLGFYSCTVPTLEQYLLCDLIESGDFERHINRIRRKMRRTGAEPE